MSTSGSSAGDVEIPAGLIDAVTALVATGAVPLGGFTLAELDAVSAAVHFLEHDPAPEVIAEAVRSLAARNLITTTAGDDELQVRGDLGIILAFQQRARRILDARVTGTQPDHPWRFALMPQPEGACLEVLVDALGIHFFSLRATSDAFERLWQRLPSGERADGGADPDAVLQASPQTALVSVTQIGDTGEQQTHDLVLASDGDRCHVFTRSADAPDRLVAQPMATDEWRGLLTRLATPGAGASASEKQKRPA